MATTQQYAYLSERVYDEPNVNAVYTDDKKYRYTAPDGHQYRVLENMSNSRTGYQGTIYQDLNSGEIIVAHRGTESMRDVSVDIAMVQSRTNAQLNDAMRLTEHAKRYAQDYQQVNNLPHTPTISITGHSLGGTLAQVTAYRSGLYGEAFSPYGSVGLRLGVPHGGLEFKNHMLAGDAVNATSPHYGTVSLYETLHGVRVLTDPALNHIQKARALQDEHSISNFTSSKGHTNVLDDPQAQIRVKVYHQEIEQFRTQITHDRQVLGVVLHGGTNPVSLTKAAQHIQEEEQAQTPNRQRQEAIIMERAKEEMKLREHNSSTQIPHNQRSENETIPPQYRQLHSQVDQHIRQLYQERAIPFSNGGENTVMSCTAQAYQRGFDKVDQIKVKDGEIALFTQQPFGYQVAQLNALEAANIPVQTSLQQMNDWAQQMQVAQLAQAQNQSQGMSMSR